MALSPASEQLLRHLPALCNIVRRLAVTAGDHVLQFYDESGSAADAKNDGSPVTAADREAEEIIAKGLRETLPDVPMIGEEAFALGHIPDLAGHDWFWLVDPIDGTKEFIRGSPDFTVNIGLIHQGAPVLGVVYAPVPGELYAGCGPGTAIRWLADSGSEKPISVRQAPAEGLHNVSSRNHGDPVKLDGFLQEFKVAKATRRGSSIKLCLIAAGKADLYPRFGETREWDTAAGDAVIRSAGGRVVDMTGSPLTYGHADIGFVSPEFVASSGFWPVTEE